jgi:hypothetical protein
MYGSYFQLFGSGAIRHEKAFNVLQTIAESPLQCSFPLWDKIDAFLDEYQRMTKNPLRYGHLAERLCGKELEIPRKMLHLFWPDICAFVNLYMMNGNSKLFERQSDIGLKCLNLFFKANSVKEKLQNG